MDGVPVKISEKYKPPRKIVLPVGFQNRVPQATANEDYDFSLESSVLDKIKEWQKLQKAVISERRERIKKADEAKKNKTSVAENQQPVPATGKPPVSVSTSNVDSIGTQQQQYSSILMPVPICTSLNTATHKANSQFNLSDFEADTSDPFDSVELKTINDMEELAHVLQPTVNATSVSTATNCYTLPYNSQPHFRMPVECNKDPTVLVPHLNGLTRYKLLRDGEFTTLPLQQKNSAYITHQGYWCDSFGEPAPTNLRSSQQDGAGSGVLSKSVPDIMKELDREVREKHRGATPPVLPSTRPASFGSTGLENWKPWPDLDSPEQVAQGNTMKPQRSAFQLPDPFPELSPEEQRFATHISEMGFPLPRVARACQLVGNDDKKVVEFLLLVQTLEERGHPGDRAERALTVNDCDLKEAERCLQATAQLLDLGFPEDRVAEALAKSNNDRDQALEYLIS